MRTTLIDGIAETDWAMAQVARVFGFSSIAEIRQYLKYDEYGVASMTKGGLTILATTNKNAWATLKIAWRGVGVQQREAALEYSERYIKQRRY